MFLHRRPPVARDARAHVGREEEVPESIVEPKGHGVGGSFLPLQFAWDECSAVRMWVCEHQEDLDWGEGADFLSLPSGSDCSWAL